MALSLVMTAERLDQVRGHLAEDDVEQVGFLITEPIEDGASALRVLDYYAVPPDGFTFQSDYHVALKDEVRADVIKRAWDAGGSLNEVHSHENGDPAAFSPSD